MLITSSPGSAFASINAARTEQFPKLSAHTPLPGAISTESVKVFTSKVAACAELVNPIHAPAIKKIPSSTNLMYLLLKKEYPYLSRLSITSSDSSPSQRKHHPFLKNEAETPPVKQYKNGMLNKVACYYAVDFHQLA
ncbi:hypothetical protein D3C73_585590 [compost metagenome]